MISRLYDMDYIGDLMKRACRILSELREVYTMVSFLTDYTLAKQKSQIDSKTTVKSAEETAIQQLKDATPNRVQTLQKSVCFFFLFSC